MCVHISVNTSIKMKEITNKCKQTELQTTQTSKLININVNVCEYIYMVQRC